MSVNGASTIFELAWLVICVPIGWADSSMPYRLALSVNKRATCSLLHSQYERQRSINDFRSCKSGNSKAILSFLCMIKALATIIEITNSYTLHAPSWIWESMECQWFLTFHHRYSKRDASVIVCIWCSDHFSRPKQSLTSGCIIGYEISCYYLGGCCGNVACLSAQRVCQFLLNRGLQSCAI